MNQRTHERPLDILPSDLGKQRTWSIDTFGPGFREGVFKHIKKELKEIQADPLDVFEWADLLILAFDGAMRAGHTPEEIIQAYHQKVEINQDREWPNWRNFGSDEAIEHVR